MIRGLFGGESINTPVYTEADPETQQGVIK